MRKYAFKLFTSNLINNPVIVDEVEEFVRNNPDKSFIELMVINSTPEIELQEFIRRFKGLTVNIHAPHNSMGFDTGKKELERSNLEKLEKSIRLAEEFDSKAIIVHAGCGRDPENIKETIRQFKIFDNPRIVVENLPVDANDTPDVMHGNTPEEIKYIMEETGCGFCFDFSHAVCAANYLKINVEEQLQGFFDLKPRVYHLCDGDIDGVDDKHLHYGRGSYLLKEWLHKYTTPDAMITMETGEGAPQGAQDWIEDFGYLQRLEQGGK